MSRLFDLGARLKEERERLGKNQNEFARVGGVNRNSQSAYETGKTPATVEYLLSIETTGVDLGYVLWGSRRAERLSPKETELLACFAALDKCDQGGLLTVASSMAGRVRPSLPAAESALQAELPPTRALARMFEGLLLGLDRNAPADAFAHDLARLLPIGLAQLVDLLPPEDQPAPVLESLDGDREPRRVQHT